MFRSGANALFIIYFVVVVVVAGNVSNHSNTGCVLESPSFLQVLASNFPIILQQITDLMHP